MFDEENFWNICGVWEKSISLMMKIPLSFMKFLTFFLPVLWHFLFAYYVLCDDCEFRDKLGGLWFLSFYVISFTHWLGGFGYGIILKEHMEGFTIGWLRLNLILVLTLAGLQAYVSYIKSRFSESATKFEKIIHI